MSPLEAEILSKIKKKKKKNPHKSRNFYPIDTKLGIHTGVVRLKLDLCGCHRSGDTFPCFS